MLSQHNLLVSKFLYSTIVTQYFLSKWDPQTGDLHCEQLERIKSLNDSLKVFPNGHAFCLGRSSILDLS